MNKYRELFEKYISEVGRAPHPLTRVWVLGFCDWLARNESGLTPRAADEGYCEANCIDDPNKIGFVFCPYCGKRLRR